MDFDFRLFLESVFGAALLFVAWLGKRSAATAARQATEANDAVNHRHKGQPRLFDVVLKNHGHIEELVQWKRSYDDSPWKTGEGVNEWLAKYSDRLDRLTEQCDECGECPKKRKSER